jgi:uncharacterized protein (DUF1810 family)
LHQQRTRAWRRCQRLKYIRKRSLPTPHYSCRQPLIRGKLSKTKVWPAYCRPLRYHAYLSKNWKFIYLRSNKLARAAQLGQEYPRKHWRSLLDDVFLDEELNMVGITDDDPFDLSRFAIAQEGVYPRVLSELKNGQKKTHWIWYIFPQIEGLGESETSKFYAIKSREEAREYLNHPLLGKRLLECSEAVLAIAGRSVTEIFAFPDDLKLQSSMTLFASFSEPNSIFIRVLEKYFSGEQDVKTLQILEKLELDRH